MRVVTRVECAAQAAVRYHAGSRPGVFAHAQRNTRPGQCSKGGGGLGGGIGTWVGGRRGGGMRAIRRCRHLSLLLPICPCPVHAGKVTVEVPAGVQPAVLFLEKADDSSKAAQQGAEYKGQVDYIATVTVKGQG